MRGDKPAADGLYDVGSPLECAEGPRCAVSPLEEAEGLCNRIRLQKALQFYAVSDRAWLTEDETLYQKIEAALKGGVTCVQLREKTLSDEEFLQEAQAIAALCRHYKVPFIVNDRLDVALACNADGLHVGQDDLAALEARKALGPNKILGVSVQTSQQAKDALRAGANYLGVGAIWSTATKGDAELVGLGGLKEICELSPLPVVAIGGITKERIAEFTGIPIAGLALVSAIFSASAIEEECKELSAVIKKMQEEGGSGYEASKCAKYCG